MPYNPQLSIEGIQEVQARNLRRIAALKTTGAAGDAVKDMGIALHRYATQITHVGKYEGGGALKSSHRIEIEDLSGMIYIDPKSVSPRRGRRKQKPSVYGIYENARGGEHAFYDRTESEIGGDVKHKAANRIREAVLYAK